MKFTTTRKELRNAIRLVKHAMYNQDATRPALNSVKFEITNEGLRLIATDTHRLAVAELGRYEAVETLGECDSCMLAADAVAALYKAIERKPSLPCELEIFNTPGMMTPHIVIGGDTWHARQNLTYPNYLRILGSASSAPDTIRIQFNRETMLAACKEQIAASSKHDDSRILINLCPEWLFTTSMDMKFMQKHPASVCNPADVRAIAFNVFYLRDLLSVLDSHSVTLSSKGQLYPFKLRDGKGLEYILMPCRVD